MEASGPGGGKGGKVRQRILVDIETVEQARKIEETVKSGYLDATIEHLLQWIAVEEDIISSYGQLSARGDGDRALMYGNFARNSSVNLRQLNMFLEACESMASERKERIAKLSTLEQSGSPP